MGIPEQATILFFASTSSRDQFLKERILSKGLPHSEKQTGIHASLRYFFGYKTEFFSFQNNPKDLDPSYKMDLDLLDCLGRVKLVL